MLNAFLVALAVFICVGGAELIGFTMLNRPIVIGPLVGLFLGDLHTGVIIGASLEAVFMGVVNIGGASAAEPGIATAVGTAFAIMLGKGSEVALTLALPIGILGLQIKTVLYIFIVGMFAKTFDRLAAEGKEKQIVALHYGLWAVNWFLYSLFAFFGILFGSDAVSALLDAIPDVVMNGLTVCGGLLPAVGMAMLCFYQSIFFKCRSVLFNININSSFFHRNNVVPLQDFFNFLNFILVIRCQNNTLHN